MKKKIIVILATVISLSLLIFIGYKIFLLTYYNVDNETRNIAINSAKNFNNYNETIIINSKKINEEEYYRCENYKIKNNFSNFEMISKCDTEYLAEGEHPSPAFELKNSDGTTKEYVSITVIDNNKINSLIKQEYQLGTEKQDSKILKKIKDDNDIKNDTELLNYIYNNINNKITFFSSKNEIKEFYHINYIASTYGGLKNITLIEGNYQGYILNYDGKYENNYKKIKHVNIYNGDKILMIVLHGDEVTTDEYIKDFISTLVIS